MVNCQEVDDEKSKTSAVFENSIRGVTKCARVFPTERVDKSGMGYQGATKP